MTAVTSPDVAGETLYAALPARAQVHIQRTRKFDHDAAQAFDHGWTLDQLVQRITSGDLGNNPGGVITSRLEWCAEHDPPKTTSLGRVLPFCSPECRDNGGWVLDNDGRPVKKCPCRTPERT